MNLEQIATFASRPDGKVWRDICERFSMDPAYFFEDDFLAYQFRVALCVAHPHEEPKEAEPEVDADYAEHARRRMEMEARTRV